MNQTKPKKQEICINGLRFHGNFNNETKKQERTKYSSAHSGCEIYVCLSQNVSFVVENKPYRVKHGDVIITRPYETHRYVCLDKSPHQYFCFGIESGGNEELLGLFFDRNIGEGNLISLPESQKETLLTLCRTFSETDSALQKSVAFFKILELLAERGITSEISHISNDVKISMDYIKNNFKSPITVPMLADISHVTVNTLERHFKATLGMSPREYLQSCRFVSAISIMKQGGSVSEAAEESGFSDYSYFISLFKKKYGQTPYQFKKGL